MSAAVTASRSPTLAEVLRLALSKQSIETRVALPGRVESYDGNAQRADILPLLKETYFDESGTEQILSLPVIPRVPVLFPGAGGYRIVLPVQRGDIVLLVFTDRSLDKWKATGGEVDPIDLRRHALTDAVAIPCLPDPAGTSATKSIEIQSDGTIVLAGGSASVGRVGDAVSATSSMGTWIDAVTTFVNSLAPGTAVPPVGFGTIAAGATKVKA